MPGDQSRFSGAGHSRGRGLVAQAAWHATNNLVFKKWWLPARARPAILRAFGASVGHGVVIKQDVRIHWPWKLAVGDNSWIGEGSWLHSIEPIWVGSNVCISQAAFITAGSHDAASPTFEYDNAPVRIGDGSWIAARAIVLRGVTIGERSIVAANTVVARSTQPDARVRPDTATAPLP
ncbi:MAG: putative colanic acid biosynthesis acetyltransferase [Actinomycetota bacterium]|nr:MAG: putative colanic acid biosynthesis acetyltransferase [Actinomycetota bacterium]